ATQYDSLGRQTQTDLKVVEQTATYSLETDQKTVNTKYDAAGRVLQSNVATKQFDSNNALILTTEEDSNQVITYNDLGQVASQGVLVTETASSSAGQALERRYSILTTYAKYNARGQVAR